jgi:hypothetical protein
MSIKYVIIRGQVALINYVLQPPRDREEHLKVFLHHMHPILQRQQLDYRIIVVEQTKDEDFNRAGVSYVKLRHVEHSKWSLLVYT